MQSSVQFTFTNAKTTESHRHHLLADTPWVTSEGHQVSLWSRQAKIRIWTTSFTPRAAQEIEHLPSASHLSPRSFTPADPFQCRRALQSRDTKKLLRYSRFLHGN